MFQRLLENFTWWVNRKDPDDRNLFQGGFLGLDNIGVFDRSAPLPGGGTLEQADGTAWMGLYCQAMLQIALELARHDPVYANMAAKFTTHFVWIAAATNPPDGDSLWDEEDGFYYDVMRMPDGSTQQLRVRSLVGLLPLCAATVIEPEVIERVPDLMVRFEQFVEEYKDAIPALGQRPGPGVGGRRLASLVGEERIRRILSIMLDENRSSSARTGSARSRATTPITRTSSTSRARSSGSTTSRPSHTRGCSAATRTGAARCGSR